MIFYIDAANAGQFADLPITALKMPLGIFTRKARDKDYMWRTLGYVPTVSKHKSGGKRVMVTSGHLDAIMQHQDYEEEEGIINTGDVCKAQDLHTMLDVTLESYVELQETGFVWDLMCRNHNYRNVEFVLFTPFIKVGSDEAGKLCGKYTSRD